MDFNAMALGAQLIATGAAAVNMAQIGNFLDVILEVVGGFLGWQGVYQLISAKTEHKPDQGTDAWWTIALGAFCLGTGVSHVLSGFLNSLTW